MFSFLGISLSFSAGTLIQSWGPALLHWCWPSPPSFPAWRESTISVWMSPTSTWTSRDRTPPSQSLPTKKTPQMLRTPAQSRPDPPSLFLDSKMVLVLTARAQKSVSYSNASDTEVLPTLLYWALGKMPSAGIRISLCQSSHVMSTPTMLRNVSQ